jgi:hypothetical protein
LWKPAQQEETAAAVEVASQMADLIPETRQGKVFPRDGRRGETLGDCVLRGCDDLLALSIVERDGPFVRIGNVSRAPYGGRRDRRSSHGG